MIHHIHGLSRSGNHAIIFWMIHNMVSEIKHIEQGIYIDDESTVCYLNNVNIQSPLLKRNFNIDHFKFVLYSYEDNFFNKTTSIIILRDFLNLVCSRYQKYHNNKHNIGLNNKYICDIFFLIEVWKQHTKLPNKTILYNKWLESKTYRNIVSTNIVGIDNSIDNIEYIPEIGDGSSFDQKIDESNAYLSRYELVDLPKHIRQTILKDTELLDLNKRIFNIDITEYI